MDDELLQAVKDLESTRAELARQSVVQYKESLGFKEGLKRMSRIMYEYGYRKGPSQFGASLPRDRVGSLTSVLRSTRSPYHDSVLLILRAAALSSGRIPACLKRRISSIQPPSSSSTVNTIELTEGPMVLTIILDGVSVTQEEASLAKASTCAFSLRGTLVMEHLQN
ncbi:hypothetical protein BHE74_00013162 [Ensete ventricosum]|nr:hypothetical protein BHE74_00013162 [Ensete ventricosum]